MIVVAENAVRSRGGGPGGAAAAEPRRFQIPGVTRVIDPSTEYRKASWTSRGEPTVVELPNGTRIGGREIVVMAGPAEPGDLLAAAHRLRAAGSAVLHAGTFRPHRSPYAQREGEAGTPRALSRVREETGMAVVAEVLDLESARLLAGHVDVLQVSAANMQNFPLLSGVARLGKPVLLVRGPSATLTELLMSAEYVLAAGNDDAILCEGGVWGLPPEGRTLLDLTAVPVLKSLTHLPVVVAPGATAEMACAAVAAGADGLVLEPAGCAADALDRALERARRVAPAMGRRLA